MPRHFTHWLKAYCEFTAASESPTPFHFWTGVSTIAGALQRHVWQEQYLFQWLPNFYIILVAPPGVATKSTTLNFGMNLLTKVPDVKFGPDSGSWQGLGDALAEATHYFEYQNGEGKETRVAQSPITVAASELGTFLRPDDEHAMSFLTDTWDGKKRPYIHKTKHSGGISIEGPWLNFIGATTPAWLRRNYPESLIGEGLTSRIIFVYAETKRHYVSLPSRRIKHRDHYEFEEKLVADLIDMSALRGPINFTLEVEQEGGWMDKWYEDLHSNRSRSMASDRFGGYIARKQTHLVKLAMILSVAQRSDLTITIEDLEAADSILVDAERSMLKVFESIGVVDEAQKLAELIAFVKAYKWMDKNELYQCCYNIMSKDQFLAAYRVGLESGILIPQNRDGKVGVVFNENYVTKH